MIFELFNKFYAETKNPRIISSVPLALICLFSLFSNDLSIVTLQLIKHSECDVEREENSP